MHIVSKGDNLHEEQYGMAIGFQYRIILSFFDIGCIWQFQYYFYREV